MTDPYHLAAEFTIKGDLRQSNHLSHDMARELRDAVVKRLDATSRLALVISDDAAAAIHLIFTHGSPDDIVEITRIVSRHAAGIAYRVHCRGLAAELAGRSAHMTFDDEFQGFEPDVAMHFLEGDVVFAE